MQTNAGVFLVQRRSHSFSPSLSFSLTLFPFLSRRARGRVNFVITETEDSNATKDVALEIRRGWVFSMLTSFLLKIRSPVKIE